MTDRWHNRFFNLAESVAQWSKDPSTKVGAVIVDADRRIVSTGYNGPPRGTVDKNWAREIKLLRTLHAEENAILFARRDLRGHTLYSTHHLCAHCAGVVIQVGISAVYWLPPPKADDFFASRWSDSMEQAQAMLREAGIDHGVP